MITQKLNTRKQLPNPINNIKGTVILPSTVHGYGLFIKNAKKNQVLCVLDGQVIDYVEFEELTKLRRDLPFIEWNAISKEKILVRMFRTKYSYINHSRKPNCYVELGEDSFVYLRAKEDLYNVELLLDYREEPLADSYIASHGCSYL